MEPPAPVLRAKYKEKIITADVADKVSRRINSVIQALRQAQQNLITFGIAVDVIERLEVVDIHIAHHHFTTLLQQTSQALLDRHIARQQGQRIGITGLLD